MGLWKERNWRGCLHRTRYCAVAGISALSAFDPPRNNTGCVCDGLWSIDKENNMAAELVLVTGGSGFIGSHCIVQLLNAGYCVRTSVRSLSREAEVREMLKRGGVEPGDAFSVVAADLSADAGWKEAVAGCSYVLHVASPFPIGVPKREDDLIVPARDGALRVLRAAHDAGVRRVVMTSSFAAIGNDPANPDGVFTEKNWSDPSADIGAYAKSKTLAERAAWEFIAREGGALELTVVNPVGVYGPLLGPHIAASIELVRRLMAGEIPGCPRLMLNIVDVRDVAYLHLRAMTDPAAKGERFLAVSGECMSVQQIALLLKGRMGAAGARVPTREIPDWVIRLGALVDPTIRQIAPDLGKVKRASGEKARQMLGWSPRSNEDAILATAESLLQLGVLKSSQKAM